MLRLQSTCILFFLVSLSIPLNAQIDLEPARTFISVRHQKPFRLEYALLNQQSLTQRVYYTQAITPLPRGTLVGTLGYSQSKDRLPFWLSWQHRVYSKTAHGLLKYLSVEAGVREKGPFVGFILERQSFDRELYVQGIVGAWKSRRWETAKAAWTERLFPGTLPEKQYYSVIFGMLELTGQHLKEGQGDSKTLFLTPCIRLSMKNWAVKLLYMHPIWQSVRQQPRFNWATTLQISGSI